MILGATRRAMIAGLVMALCACGPKPAPEPVAAPPPPPPPVAAPEPVYKTATLQTSMGDIVIELETEKAPITVANFVRYTKAGWYENIAIYRAEPGFLIQMGNVLADGSDRTPLYRPIKLETDTGLKHKRGTVALTREEWGPDSGTSTFYINLANLPHLDAKKGAEPNTTGFAVFGKVIEGMDIVDKIAARKRKSKKDSVVFPEQEPVEPVIVTKVVLGE